MPFQCAGFEPSELERRRARVECQLTEHPEQRVAMEALDAPLLPAAGEPVSLLVACRTAAGIVSAELRIPRDRFDPALIVEALEATAGRPT